MFVVALAGPLPPAVANEASQRLVDEALAAMRATPPRPVEALVRLRAATQADPRDARAWFLRGGYALLQFEPAEALEALDRAAALDSRIANLQFFRGRALQDIGRHADALQAFDREPNKEGNPAFWFHRGISAKEAKRYAEALADFDRSDSVYPAGRAATQLHRGDIYTAQGRAADATKAYETVVTLDPKSPVAGTAEERLRILRRPVEPGAPRNLFVRGFLGAEYDTNVASIDTQTARPSQLPRKADSRAVADVNVRYYLFQTEATQVGLTGDARISFHRRDTNYDDALLGGSLFGSRAFGPARLGGDVRFDRTWIDDDGYSQAANGTVWASWRFNPSHETVFAYRRRWQDFDLGPPEPQRDRDGDTDYLSISHVVRPWSAGVSFVEIEPAIRYGRERTAGGYFDNDEWTGFLTVRGQFQRFTHPTFVEAGLIYGRQVYTDLTVQRALNVETLRSDETFTQLLRVVQPLTQIFGIEGLYQHTRNSSNVQGFSYGKHLFRVGLVFWF